MGATGLQLPPTVSGNPPEGAEDPPLEADSVTVELGAFCVDALDLTVPRGQVTALLGPNGSGKTTILKTLSRLIEPDAGTVYLDGRALAGHPTKEIARRVAVLPQSGQAPEGVTVRELAGLGRYPHRGPIGGPDEEDRAQVARALEATGMEEMADRPVESLSGGERQRAWLAMALAQDADVLLLDEPTTYLDIRYQVEVLSLVRSLNREHGITVVQVLHDLNQAAAYSDRVVLLDDGTVAAEGPPAEALTPDVLEAVFDVPVTVTTHPTAGTPFVVPLDPRSEETLPPEPTPPEPS